MRRAHRMMTAGALGLALCAATAQGAAATDGHGGPPPPTNGTTTLPVAFTVHNTNTSELACDTDGREHTVRGTITAPAGDVDATTASLYLHGLDLGQSFWTGAYRGASFTGRQAAAGHVSVSIDRLGYDTSDKPDGYASCMGAQADVAHQVVQQLRAGSYTVSNGAADPEAFEHVVLQGHSLGAGIAALEAASYGDVDALVLHAYSDRILSEGAKADAAAAVADCEAGGESTEGEGSGGYAFFSSSADDFRQAFFATTPAPLVEGALAQRNRNACGDLATVTAIGEANVATNERVDVPVLVIAGGADAIYPEPAGEDLAGQFTGSEDVQLVTLPGTAHSLATEDTAPQWADTVSSWLNEQGLGD